MLQFYACFNITEFHLGTIFCAILNRLCSCPGSVEDSKKMCYFYFSLMLATMECIPASYSIHSRFKLRQQLLRGIFLAWKQMRMSTQLTMQWWDPVCSRWGNQGMDVGNKAGHASSAERGDGEELAGRGHYLKQHKVLWTECWLQSPHTVIWDANWVQLTVGERHTLPECLEIQNNYYCTSLAAVSK